MFYCCSTFHYCFDFYVQSFHQRILKKQKLMSCLVLLFGLIFNIFNGTCVYFFLFINHGV
jgi:hypothetical protein